MGTLRLAGRKRLSVSKKPGQEEMKDEPKQVSNDEKCKQLEEQMENSEFYKEYESVPMCRPGRQCTIASYPENVDKNRYQDVVPYEDTRVKLVPTKENSIGYINASHIRVKVGEQEWHYIATQGPLSHTCQDFWQMIWEQGVSIIAMVTAEEENGREKSFRYWPRLGSQKNTVTFGVFKITTQSHKECGCYATTMLKIQHLLTGQERTACHLQYTDWPTYSCPEDFKGFLAYLGEIQSTRKNTNSIDDSVNINPPMVVHCSAGAGRSGVVILSEIIIACLENNELLDIPKFLQTLRDQRMMMVQTLPQYTFVYKVLIEHHRNSRLI